MVPLCSMCHQPTGTRAAPAGRVLLSPSAKFTGHLMRKQDRQEAVSKSSTKPSYHSSTLFLKHYVAGSDKTVTIRNRDALSCILQGDDYETVTGNSPKNVPATTATPLAKSGDNSTPAQENSLLSRWRRPLFCSS